MTPNNQKHYGAATGMNDTPLSTPNNKCDCAEASCKKDCTRNHTHKGFWCEKCHPERYDNVGQETLAENPTPNKDFMAGRTWLWRGVSSDGQSDEWGLGTENSCDIACAERIVDLSPTLLRFKEEVEGERPQVDIIDIRGILAPLLEYGIAAEKLNVIANKLRILLSK